MKRLSFLLIEKQILEHAAAVQYTCDQERIEAEDLAFHAKRSVIIPNAVLTSRLSERTVTSQGCDHSERAVIVFIGRIDPKKGLDLLIRSFSQLRRRHPDCALTIAGTGDPQFEARLRTLAKEESVEQYIRWAGFVSGTMKQDLLASASVFVLPSYSENFGVAAAEAMAAGVPVVVSDQTGVHPLVTRYRAGIVSACNVQALADSLGIILDNPIRGRIMGMCGRRLVNSEFSLPVVTEKIGELYHSTLSGLKRPS